MTNILKKISFFKDKNFTKNIIPLAFSAYIIINIYHMAQYRQQMFDVTNNRNINLIQLIIVFSALTVGLNILNFFLAKITYNFPRFVLFGSSVVFSVASVVNRNLDIYFNIVILVILFYIINYCFSEDGIKLPQNKISFRALMIAVAVLVAAYTVVMGYATILRYMTYMSSTFDFGIFAQMFENMAKTGLQTTTVERNMELSHFAVHFSPIYYLLLPGYMLFRTPEYLLVVQALFVASAAFPLVLIAKKLDFTNEHSLLLAVTYLFYPTITGGIFFDFHENKFLTILILWLFYFVLSEKIVFVYIFAALTLTVKEDAFLYVLFIALYLIASRKKFNRVSYLLHGLILAVLSLAYFAAVSAYMKNYGLGIMLYRYNLFLDYGQYSFFDIIFNIIKNPSLIFANILAAEKFIFVLYMLLPLCFLPFMSKNYRFIILIGPFIIINLATDYIYQYNINFQYAYATTALLFFLAIQNLSKINPRYISKLCIAMACCSIVLFMSNNYNKIHRYDFIYTHFADDFIETDEILARIPSESSVTATTFLIPHLIIRHEKVYMGDMEKLTDYFSYDTDYIINDIRGVDYAYYNQVLARLRDRGYEKVDSGIFVEVFRKKQE